MLNHVSLETITVPVVAFIIAGIPGVLATCLAAALFNKNADTASSIAIEFIKFTTINCLFLGFSGFSITFWVLAMGLLNFIHPVLQSSALLGFVVGGPFVAMLSVIISSCLLGAIKLCQLAHRFFSNMSKETEYPKYKRSQDRPVPASKIPSPSNQPASTLNTEVTPEENASRHSLHANG